MPSMVNMSAVAVSLLLGGASASKTTIVSDKTQAEHTSNKWGRFIHPFKGGRQNSFHYPDENKFSLRLNQTKAKKGQIDNIRSFGRPQNIARSRKEKPSPFMSTLNDLVHYFTGE